MRKIAIIVGASVGLCATPAQADPAPDGYQPFDVTRSAARRGISVTRFDLAGAPVSINAYGRKSRARLFDATAETRDLRRQAAAFDNAAKPALLTLEMRLHF